MVSSFASSWVARTRHHAESVPARARQLRLALYVGAGVALLTTGSEIVPGERAWCFTQLLPRAAFAGVAVWISRTPLERMGLRRFERVAHQLTWLATVTAWLIFSTSARSPLAVSVGALAVVFAIAFFYPVGLRRAVWPSVASVVFYSVTLHWARGDAWQDALQCSALYAAMACLGLLGARRSERIQLDLFRSLRSERSLGRTSELLGQDFIRLFDVSPVPLAIIDPHERVVVRRNLRFDRTFGAEACGGEVEVETFFPHADQYLHRVERSDVQTDFRARMVKFDGTPMHVKASVHATSYKNQPAVVLAVQDLSAERKAHRALTVAKDKAEEANRTKTLFIANMSHEIRTPMNGVLGMVELLNAERLEPDQKEMVRCIRDSGEALLRIINDILDLSKVEAGELKLDLHPFDLEELARGVHTLIEHRPDAAGVELGLELDLPSDPWFTGDAGRLRQVAVNLVGNAVKFTAGGSVRTSWRVRDVAEVGYVLRFEVRDTGVGIESSQLAKLFKPFAQADASTTRKYGGTGLGLSISKSLVKLMGGKIGAESRVGKGSTFWFEVPLDLTDRPFDSTTGSLASKADTGVPEPLVLVVDDNVINRRVAERMLLKLGAKVELACDGLQAVSSASERHYDLILMDVQMPGMDGLEATRRIRAAEGEERSPIVAMTAHAMAGDEAVCLRAGMDGYLTKPARARALREMLQRFVGGAGVRELTSDEGLPVLRTASLPVFDEKSR